MKFEFWTVAYRKRQGGCTLLDDKQSPFHVIPNNWRYWYADPHLITVDGQTWAFAEAYDRVLRRGVISCCQITESGATPWKVALKQPYHLSYPHLLEHGGKIYMIPESYVAGEIAVFRAKHFPDKWEKAAVLKHGGGPVDSTVLHFGGKSWLISSLADEGSGTLTLYPLSENGISGDGYCAKRNDPNVRPAGHPFQIGDRLIRPAQDCTGSYGCALNLYEVCAVSEENYEERLLAKIKPEELNSDLGYKACGVHTYNLTDEYEILDFKGYETDPLFWVMRPVWFIWRRVRKVFMK